MSTFNLFAHKVEISSVATSVNKNHKCTLGYFEIERCDGFGEFHNIRDTLGFWYGGRCVLLIFALVSWGVKMLRAARTPPQFMETQRPVARECRFPFDLL
jgi:hypothetical protein